VAFRVLWRAERKTILLGPPCMQARVVRELSDFANLEASWNEMTAQSEFSEPFYSWTWQMSWWKHFASEGELFIVAVYDAHGNLCAIAPFMKKTTTLRGFPVKVMSFAANAITPRSTILYRRDRDPVEAVDAVLRCLADHRMEWDWANLENIDGRLTYLGSVGDLCRRHGMRVLTCVGRRSPYITIGDNFEGYLLKVLNRERRHSIRRKVRVLSRENYEVREFSRPEEMDWAIDRAMAVSRASWKGAEGSDMASSRARSGFYTEIAKGFAGRGQARIWLSFLNGSPIALEYYVTRAGKLYFLVNDFDKSFEKWSPGTVLIYQVVEQLHSERAEELDFGGEAYEYKMKWATGVRQCVRLQLFNRNWYSRFLLAAKTRILPLLRRIRDIPRRIGRRGEYATQTQESLVDE